MARCNQPHRKELRRIEAETRAQERALRTHVEQLQLLDTRPGNSTKERKRLERLMEKE